MNNKELKKLSRRELRNEIKWLKVGLAEACSIAAAAERIAMANVLLIPDPDTYIPSEDRVSNDDAKKLMHDLELALLETTENARIRGAMRRRNASKIQITKAIQHHIRRPALDLESLV